MIDEGSFKVYEPIFDALGPGLYMLIGTLIMWELTLLLTLMMRDSGRLADVLVLPAFVFGLLVTGVVMTPDARTMFVNIQHPGESPSGRSDPANPKAHGSWPNGESGGRPRSATIVIRKDDGGAIGT